MNSRALSGTARPPGCDVEVSASQAGSRRATNFNLQSGNSHGAPSCRINLQCGKARLIGGREAQPAKQGGC